MVKCKRRTFILQATVLSLGSLVPAACGSRDGGKSGKAMDEPIKGVMEDGLQKNRAMPRDLVMQLLDQKVDGYMQTSGNCAQSSYLALAGQFEMKSDEVLKALTPLPGIAEQGETCGAVTGPLMVFGQIYGRGENRLHDWDAYRDSLLPSGRFCELFRKEFGSTLCRDIQEDKFGRSFQLTDPEELTLFQAADATGKCSDVVRKAVRMAADIILNDPDASYEI
jgi:C_GCAxxG_C_C family probable redox protein